jgi:hypothetical protein
VTEASETDDQRRARGLPPEPRQPGAGSEPAEPPAPVRVSFWLWIVAGLGLIAGFGRALTRVDDISAAIIEINNDPNISDEQIRAGAASMLWVLFIGAVVFATLFALFAYKAREGTRSTRPILVVLATVALILQLPLYADLITLGSVLVACAAIVLMYLPSVASYFPQVPRRSR